MEGAIVIGANVVYPPQGERNILSVAAVSIFYITYKYIINFFNLILK